MDAHHETEPSAQEPDPLALNIGEFASEEDANVSQMSDVDFNESEEGPRPFVNAPTVVEKVPEAFQNQAAKAAETGGQPSQGDPVLDSDGIELTRPAMNRDAIKAEIARLESAEESESQMPPVDDRPTLVSPVLPDELFPCHQCGAPQPKEFKFCGACGARLEHSLSPPTEKAPSEESTELGNLVLIHPDGTEGDNFLW